MSSIGGIGGGGGAIRLAVQQSLVRSTPSTSFGTVLQQARVPGRVPSPSREGTPTLTTTLEDLVAALFEVENYARRNAPTLIMELAQVRAQVQILAARSG